MQVREKDSGKEITVDTRKATESGESVALVGNTVSFTKGPVTLIVTSDGKPQNELGIITADVKSVTLKNAPVSAQVKDIGQVSASFEADLVDIPPEDATVASAIVEKPDPLVQAAYERAVSEQGSQIGSVAYTLKIEKTLLPDKTEVGPATIRMSVSPEWVMNHGGLSNVRIARYADDGITQVLDTKYTGQDESSNMIFEGSSPGGLSIFALITIEAGQVTVTPEPTTPLSLPPVKVLSVLVGIFVLLLVVLLLLRRL